MSSRLYNANIVHTFAAQPASELLKCINSAGRMRAHGDQKLLTKMCSIDVTHMSVCRRVTFAYET